MTILSGLRVIEIPASGAAAWAGKHVADWGAEVTILEPTEGTPLRDAPPYYQKDERRKSGAWEWLSRGKTSVRVGEEGTALTVEAARELCAKADLVLIEQEMAVPVLGLKPVDVRPHFDGKTTCVLISPFDTDGPYADYAATDLTLHALGGWMGGIGDADREPLRPGGDILARVSGASTLVAALVGLRHVRQGGEPQFIDLSEQAVAASMLVPQWLSKSMVGIAPGRRASQGLGGVMECADGFVGCSPLTAGHWEMICRMMGIEDVLDQPGGREFSYRQEHAAELNERVRPWFEQRTRREVFEAAQRLRIPSAPVQNVAERLDCPQLEARKFFVAADIDGKIVKVPRVPYSIKGLKPVERKALQEAETVESAAPSSAASQRTDAPTLPFTGIRVLDLTTFWSGPACTMLLGTLGADVIKVESVQRPDPFRYTLAVSSLERWFERGPLWNDTNCDKRDITLNLTSETGKKLFRRLAEDADIVISNYSNRVMPNLGLTGEELLSINPQLIVVSMPGYGPGGPWEDYIGYGVAFEQLAVCASITGYADSEPRIMGGFCDPTVGLHTVTAIELALRHREQTGKGTEVEVPQCETLDSLFAPEHVAVQHGAPVPARRGNQHEWMAPHNSYRVADGDRWIAIAVASDAEFAALTGVLGVPELAGDRRFATVAARKENEAALDVAIAAAVEDKQLVPLERAIQAAGVKASRVTEPSELDKDDGLQHRRFFQTLDREVTGNHSFKTWPFRFSSIDTSHKRPPPLLGQHNAEVLTELLGLSQEELASLEREQIIGDSPLGLAG